MIVRGAKHTIIQNEKNEIYVCGWNYYGQLGLGDDEFRDQFERVRKNFGKIKNIVCGANYTVIQNEKNEVYVCGDNFCGQLGLGDNKHRYQFEKVNFDFGEIKNIACGANYTIIQNEKNDVYVCGRNWDGQLGLKDKKDRYNFEKVDYDLGKIKNIACGYSHTVVQTEKNEIYVCGSNDYGQLVLKGEKNIYEFEKVEYDLGKIKNIECGAFHTIIQNEKNDIYIYGGASDFRKVLCDDKGINKFAKNFYPGLSLKNIAYSGTHMIIQNGKNEIYVCGHNGSCQLGLGDDKHRNKFEKVDYDFGEIKKMLCGNNHTMIQNVKNEIYVCGLNDYGQLGLGDKRWVDTFEKLDTNNIFEKIYNFELKLNTEGIDL